MESDSSILTKANSFFYKTSSNFREIRWTFHGWGGRGLVDLTIEGMGLDFQRSSICDARLSLATSDVQR